MLLLMDIQILGVPLFFCLSSGTVLVTTLKVQVMNTTRSKEEARIRQEKGKEAAYPPSGHSASETPSEEGYGHSWESDDWYSSLPDDSSCSTTA